MNSLVDLDSRAGQALMTQALWRAYLLNKDVDFNLNSEIMDWYLASRN